MARPEDLAARKALASEAEFARQVNANRVSPSRALAVVNQPKPVVQPAARPVINLPAEPAAKRPILSLTGPKAATPATPTLTNGNIPSAINRINAPAVNPSATLNAINGKGAFLPRTPYTPPTLTEGPSAEAAAKNKIPYAPNASSAPVTPVGTATPTLTEGRPVGGYAAENDALKAQQARIAASNGAPVVNTPAANAVKTPGIASRALYNVGQWGSKILPAVGKATPWVAAALETANAYNNATTDGMTGLDGVASFAEGGGRVAAGTAGGLAGAAFGGPVGALIGAGAGYAFPDFVNAGVNRMLGTDTELSSKKAARLQRPRSLAQPDSEAEVPTITNEQNAAGVEATAREYAALAAATPQEQEAIRSGAIKVEPTAEQRSRATRALEPKQAVDDKRAQIEAAQRAGFDSSPAPASAALDNQKAAEAAATAVSAGAQQGAPTETANPEDYAEISGYDGPKKNVNRRYSIEELTKLGERNVIPSANFTNPGAGVALSQASGGRENLAFGGPNPNTKYQREVDSAQAQNQATNDRATAIINARPDETTQRLMTSIEKALNAGQKRKAAGFTDLLQAYTAGKPSDALNRQQQEKSLSPEEQAIQALQLQKEGSSAEILGIQAGQAKQVAALQAALLSAPPEDQAAIKAQLDMVMNRNAPQAKPDAGAITPAKQFENLGRLAASEDDPDKKQALIDQQSALMPPPVPGAVRGTDPNGVAGWYVMKDGQRQKVDY